jgi:hypothetical protein
VRAVSEAILTLLLIGMLTLAPSTRLVIAKPQTMVVRDQQLASNQVKSTLNQPAEATYVGIAKYYDNRKAVVTSSLDDMFFNTSAWENALSMLTEKRIYHTVGIITNQSTVGTDWDYVQYWVNHGYTEAGSHSRNHVHAPYTGTDPYNGRDRVSYEWQINGSKNDIIGNLTLPNWWRYDGREYVYAWIEPYGSSDSTVRKWLGDTYYLCDRMVSSGVYDFASWDSENELFNRVGYTVEMGNPPWGGDTSVASLNSKFDYAYNNGKIYHLITHPHHVNWTEGAYADLHTDYISSRKDVWYVPFGLLYLYHWVDVRNVTEVTSTGSGQDKIFKISINETNHLNYGVSYPVTYVFNIPSNWTSGYVYYRYLEEDPWTLMDNRSSDDFFNGVRASRFNFTGHKAYVSIEFSYSSHSIYLQLRHSKRLESPVVGGFTADVDKHAFLALHMLSGVVAVAVKIGAAALRRRWFREKRCLKLHKIVLYSESNLEEKG